jgi:hypothetical protein
MSNLNPDTWSVRSSVSSPDSCVSSDSNQPEDKRVVSPVLSFATLNKEDHGYDRSDGIVPSDSSSSSSLLALTSNVKPSTKLQKGVRGRRYPLQDELQTIQHTCPPSGEVASSGSYFHQPWTRGRRSKPDPSMMPLGGVARPLTEEQPPSGGRYYARNGFSGRPSPGYCEDSHMAGRDLTATWVIGSSTALLLANNSQRCCS